MLGFVLIYYFAPDVKEQKWHWITPGAVAGVTLCAVVSLGFRLYLRFFDRYDATYGSLGSVIILLLWFYLTGIAILFGAELNAVIENAAAEHSDPEAKFKGDRTPQSEPSSNRSTNH